MDSNLNSYSTLNKGVLKLQNLKMKTNATSYLCLVLLLFDLTQSVTVNECSRISTAEVPLELSIVANAIISATFVSHVSHKESYFKDFLASTQDHLKVIEELVSKLALSMVKNDVVMRTEYVAALKSKFFTGGGSMILTNLRGLKGLLEKIRAEKDALAVAGSIMQLVKDLYNYIIFSIELNQVNLEELHKSLIYQLSEDKSHWEKIFLEFLQSFGESKSHFVLKFIKKLTEKLASSTNENGIASEVKLEKVLLLFNPLLKEISVFKQKLSESYTKLINALEKEKYNIEFSDKKPESQEEALADMDLFKALFDDMEIFEKFGEYLAGVFANFTNEQEACALENIEYLKVIWNQLVIIFLENKEKLVNKFEDALILKIKSKFGILGKLGRKVIDFLDKVIRIFKARFLIYFPDLFIFDKLEEMYNYFKHKFKTFWT